MDNANRGQSVCLILWSLAVALSGSSAIAKEIKAIDFYKQTPFTSVSIPLKIARAEAVTAISPIEEVRVLEPGLDSPNLLPKQQRYCLLINHILNDESKYLSDKAYIALKLVFVDQNALADRNSISLFRNGEMWQVRKSRVAPLVGMATPSVSLPGFIETINRDRLDNVDQELGFQWHAQPIGSRFNSWNDKHFWRPLNGQGNYDSSHFYESIKIKVNPFPFFLPGNQSAASSFLGVLLSYSPAPSSTTPAAVLASRRKVVFCFNRHNSIAAYFQLFTPIESASSTFLLIFDAKNKIISLN